MSYSDDYVSVDLAILDTLNISLIDFPAHLQRVATLPCEKQYRNSKILTYTRCHCFCLAPVVDKINQINLIVCVLLSRIKC